MDGFNFLDPEYWWELYQRHAADALMQIITWDTEMRMTEHNFQSYFFHTVLKIFLPLHFKMRFWSWKSGMVCWCRFYQKQQEFLLDRERPVRGKEYLLSLWPRAQRNGTPQFKPREAHRTLLILFSPHRDGSQTDRLAARKFECAPPECGSYICCHAESVEGKFSQSDARKPVLAECTSAMLQIHLPS